MVVGTVTYEQLVEAAVMTGTPTVTVTGKFPDSELQLNKSMQPGDSFQLADGMRVRVNVCHTNNA